MGWFDKLRAVKSSLSVQDVDQRSYPTPIYEQIFYDGDAVIVLPISNGYLLRTTVGDASIGGMSRNRIVYAKTEEEIVQQLISSRARRAMGDPGTAGVSSGAAIGAMATPINKQRNKI